MTTAFSLGLHQAFEHAELHGDAGALDALLAEDFHSIGDHGYVLDKAQWIAKFADFACVTLESSDITASVYTGAAIVRYIQHSRSTWRGQAMALSVRASQTWVAADDGWRLAGVQYSTLPDD